MTKSRQYKLGGWAWMAAAIAVLVFDPGSGYYFPAICVGLAAHAVGDLIDALEARK